MDFRTAWERETWCDVDFVLCDVEDESRIAELMGNRTVTPLPPDMPATDFPAVFLIEKIKARSPRTCIVAATSRDYVFEEDLIRDALIKAGADHYVYKTALEHVLERLAAGEATMEDELNKFGPPTPGKSRWGVGELTKLLALVRYLARPDVAAKLRAPKLKRNEDRASDRIRNMARELAGHLEPVDTLGRPSAGHQGVRITQLREILRRLTRIPESIELRRKSSMISDGNGSTTPTKPGD